MSKQVIFKDRAREEIKKGVDILANAVSTTLGPKGRNVLIEKAFSYPQITKDGVTIAKEIDLSNRLQNIGVQAVKEVAIKTLEKVGDGTTTSIVLAQAIIKHGFKNITAGANPMEIKVGLEKGLKLVIEELKKQAKPIKNDEDVKRVALISSNGDEEIANILTEIISKVGSDGIVNIEEGNTMGIRYDFVEGMQFDKGYIAPHFVSNQEDLTAEITNPYILITDQKLQSTNDIKTPLEKIMETGSKDIVIIADNVDGEALATLIVNKLKGILNVVAIKAPAFGDRRKDILQDLAVLTGGEVILSELNQTTTNTESFVFGRADKVVITKDSTTIINGKGDKAKIDERIKSIKTLIEKAENDYDKEKLKERLAKLTVGVVNIQVGASTELEIRERKDRLDDALQSTRAGIEEGIVSGGGIALIDCIKSLDINLQGDEQVGITILKKVLEQPLRKISKNAGKSGDVILDKVGNGIGYDARNDKFVNMIEAGIIDPVKVTRLALENAVSVAMLLLTTEAVIVGEDKVNSNIINEL